jgi:uncharacterized protein YggT (Ycf19 family)
LNSIDFILNLAGLLLWLNWRTLRLDPIHRLTPATLAGTVRRTEPLRLQRWHFLAALAALLLVRAFFYAQIGPAVNWTPRLELTVVTPAFPLTRDGHVFYRSAFLFSLLSFVLVFLIFHFWLLALAIINRQVTSPDSLQKLVLLQLGPIARWPVVVELALPFVVSAALWMLCHPLLGSIGVTSHVRSNTVLAEQGLILGLNAYLSLKFLLAGILLAYLIISYVYFGRNPLWDFIGTTARNILSPLNRLPLRLGRLDAAPLVGIALVILLLFVLPRFVLLKLDQHGLTLWPH